MVGPKDCNVATQTASAAAATRSDEFAWTGAFGETTTGLPIIGPVPRMPNCWIALGYGGNGTTYAALAADIIAGEITGRSDIDADLYRFPTRK
jgi:glycine/D-amino acid oxidase-like deaminating enzyme